MRSEKEVRDKLKIKGMSALVIDETISYFADLDLINDRDFARKWISFRLLKPFGINRIKFELENKGISSDVIQSEVASISHEYSEMDVVTPLVLKRLEKYKGVEPKIIKQRIFSYLSTRGFSADTIMKVTKELC